MRALYLLALFARCDAFRGRALVIGGTQFVGRHLVERLLEFDGAEVAMLNRGHTVLPETLRRAVASGELAHLKCDRMHQRERFARLVAERGPWDLVVDFVGFERQFTLDAVRALRGTGAHFVHISTDSVSTLRRTRLTPPKTRVS